MVLLVLKKNDIIIMNNKMGDNMMRNKKTIIAIALCLGVFFMSVGYSILMSELKINGKANITSTWDIRITGITTSSTVGGAYNVETPTYTATTAKFHVSLVNPGDSMTYTVTIQNKGTLKAEVDNIDVSESGTDAIIYTVSGINNFTAIAAGETVTFTVTAKYNPNVVADPVQRMKKLTVDIDWVQYNESAGPIGDYRYDVVYNSNGGSGSIASTNCIVDNSCTLATNSFTRSGYKFLGWATTPTGAPVYADGEGVMNLTSSGKTVTLYATWGQYKTYSYNGSFSTYTAPINGYYQLEVWGAEGGYRSSNTYSGKGGYTSGTIFLNKGDVLYVYVGGNGTTHSGYNGGGVSGCTIANGCTANIYGGGASDIRLGSQSIYSRIIVAGGGGSVGGTTKKGGAGGGTTGGSTTESYTGQGCSTTLCGQGGTQTAGGAGTATSGYTATAGSFGFGGQGYKYGTSTFGYGGGGGGGWYGGSGSVPDTSGDDDRGGGGGSGFALSKSGTVLPSGYLVDRARYYLTDTTLLDGTASIPSTTLGGANTTGRSGDGYARITRLTIK